MYNLLLVAILSSIPATVTAVAKVPCITDTDCAAVTAIHGVSGVSVFVCVANFCQLAVSAGNICSKSSDCAQFQWAQSKLKNRAQNISLVLGHGHSSVESYLESICQPSHCTISSTCAKDSTVLFNPTNPLLLPAIQDSVSCCGGGEEYATCTNYGTSDVFVSTCGYNAKCLASTVMGVTDLFCTGEILSKKTMWIGIIICLVGSACNSVGLNLQALATRNRAKQKQELLGKFRNKRHTFFRFNKSKQSEGLESETDRGSLEDTVQTGAATEPPRDNNISQGKLEQKMNFGELFKNPVWMLGLIVYSSANLLNFVALQFAPQSLVAPLGSVSLVVNVFAATIINNEKYSWKDVIGGLLIIGGSSMTVVFSGVNSVDYNLCVLLKLLQKPATIVFLTVTTGCLAALFCFICLVEKNVTFDSASDDEIGSRAQESNPVADLRGDDTIWTVANASRTSDDGTLTIHESVRQPVSLKPDTRISKLKRNLFEALPLAMQNFMLLLRKIQLVPRLKTKIPISSKLVSIGLPLSYASLGGMMGTLTTLFAKSTIHLLSNTFLGNNEFDSIYSWVIAFVTVFTALGQVYWINMGLERYDALLQIPVFFVVWTVFDVVGGGIYFQEFEGFSPKQYALFSFAISVIFVGVFILAGRLKQTEDRGRKQKAEAQASATDSKV